MRSSLQSTRRARAAVGCWSLHDNAELSTRLLARGFTWGWRPHWMAIAVPDVPPSPGAVLPFVVEPAAPPYFTTLPYAPLGPEPAEATRLGVRLREKIVGSVVVHPFKGVAGLYGMGVAPKVRRRGIGSALVLAALDAARAEGCRHVVLNATDDGEHCYHACGFRSLGWGQTWWWSNGPAPSSRQLQLAEAIGFGDLAALDALAPRASELTDPLPCGETPLTLALLTDQPAVGAHLLEPARPWRHVAMPLTRQRCSTSPSSTTAPPSSRSPSQAALTRRFETRPSTPRRSAGPSTSAAPSLLSACEPPDSTERRSHHDGGAASPAPPGQTRGA